MQSYNALRAAEATGLLHRSQGRGSPAYPGCKMLRVVFNAGSPADRYLYCGSRRRSIFVSRLAPPKLGHNGLRNGAALRGDQTVRLQGLVPERGLAGSAISVRGPSLAGSAARSIRGSCPSGLALQPSGCLCLNGTGTVPASKPRFPLGVCAYLFFRRGSRRGALLSPFFRPPALGLVLIVVGDLDERQHLHPRFVGVGLGERDAILGPPTERAVSGEVSSALALSTDDAVHARPHCRVGRTCRVPRRSKFTVMHLRGELSHPVLLRGDQPRAASIPPGHERKRKTPCVFY